MVLEQNVTFWFTQGCTTPRARRLDSRLSRVASVESRRSSLDTDTLCHWSLLATLSSKQIQCCACVIVIGLVQAWVGQNETFRFETACNCYISPGSRRRHVLSLSKLFSCSRRSHEHTWSPSRKVNLSQGGRHQVRLGRIRHRSSQRPLGKAPDSRLTIPLALQHLLGSRCGLVYNNEDSELVVINQTRALEAFVVALKRIVS